MLFFGAFDVVAKCPHKMAAKAQGLTTYQGATPCRKCKGALRYVGDGKCVECRRARRRTERSRTVNAAYMRGYSAEPKNKLAKVAYDNSVHGVTVRMFGKAARRAKQRGFAFDLDLDDIKTRVAAGFCEATGLPFDLRPHAGGSQRRPFGPTIDRVDNAGGYVRSNIRVTCNVYNIGKNDFSETDFLTMVHALAARTERPQQ